MTRTDRDPLPAIGGTGEPKMERGAAETFATILTRIVDASAPSAQDVGLAFEAILSGAWTPVQVAALATALRVRGETPEQIVAAAKALQRAMSVVEHGLETVVDTCGTGGDGAHTLNLSTAAAIVVAGCGCHVAKHGNRSVSSRCGSADVLEALGIPIDVPPARQGEVLRAAGIAFLMAPVHHPALRHAAQARRELGVRTIFNALGPLVNPARATHQLVGVYEDRLRAIIARALGTLGIARAWVVRGVDGLDEVSPCGPTRVSELVGGGAGGADVAVRERTIEPSDFGLRPIERPAIAGGDARTNAEAIERIVAGEAHPARDAVILNAAAVLLAAGLEEAPRRAAERARAAIDDGAATRVLEAWRREAHARVGGR
jgi:anthranilate phosphoribosyltransferase